MSQLIHTAQADCHAPIISIENVSFSFGDNHVIRNVNFQARERDFVGLIGSNGAGKSTLLRMIVGLLKPEDGVIRLFGEPIGQFRDWERIGYVPQKNSLNPLFPASVKEVVESGLYGRKKMFRRVTAQDRKKIVDALDVMGIPDLALRRIGQLSGGQQQRVFLARALVNNPDLLILDEPTVGIDVETQESFFKLIRHMHQHHHMAFFMVSHDVDMMKSYLGNEPLYTSGKLKFYVKHSHELENCGELNLTHTLNGAGDRLNR